MSDATAFIDDEPVARLSPLRVAIAVVVLAAAVGGAAYAVRNRLHAAPAAVEGTWFAPYVDATLTPLYSFQDPAANTARQVVLGFVVAQPGAGCAPSWGAIGSLSAADQSVALSSRLAQLAQDGALPIVSFGGRANTDLSVACQDTGALTRAYQAVIAAYHLRIIDLDVEGAALGDFSAVQRQAAAVHAIEAAAATAHQPLGVWLTLPVEPSGLQDNALAVVDAMLRAGVSITGVNVMAMDFSASPPSGHSMIGEVEDAATAAQRQVADRFHRYGVEMSGTDAWQHMGVTVMIGQNDVQGQRFTVGDAQGLARFATAVRLGRLSFWSLNRDRQCGSAFARVGVNSNTCSGTAQGALAFSHTFSQFNSSAVRAGTPSDAPPPVVTDPAKAPYPLWSPTVPYALAYKVVRQGYVYQAKWYNSGQDPMAQVQYSWQSPWELLGPVLPTDHAPAVSVPPGSDYPDWSPSSLYRSGDRVLFHALPYEAKWASQGASPADEAADPYGSPWKPLFSFPGEPTG
jgi:chitinase